MPKAKKSEDTETIALASSKIKKLIIKNFRCIGNNPVEIDLNDIVVLVGPNNAGKSTILRAYEVVMQHGSKLGKLKIEDFPNEKPDAEHLPEIELQTFVFDNFPNSIWLHDDEETGYKFVRERWIYAKPDVEPTRQGFRSDSNAWDEKVPWGAPNVARSRRPIPYRVDAFDNPETQAEKIINILSDILVEKSKQQSPDQQSAIEALSSKIIEIKKQIIEEASDDITEIESSLSANLSEVFQGYKVKLDPRTEYVSDKFLNVFSSLPILRMGPENGHFAPLDKQGSGARRTLLWLALKIAAELSPNRTARPTSKTTTDKAGSSDTEEYSRPHALLLDEPEICLHPNAVRDACRVLYDLAEDNKGWQVMVTTHSPAFIDLSRDNTTIVRVERNNSGNIEGTTVLRPEKAKISDKDKDYLKLLNQWDPYVAEFLFGGKTVIVEGDTEYSAFREIIENDRKTYRDVHVVRARGKYIIPILGKIMNHFNGRYAVLHDSDRPKTKDGKTNSAWTANERIRDVCKNDNDHSRVRLAASIIDFEYAVFGDSASGEKPYYTVQRIRNDKTSRNKVEELLKYLIFDTDKIPFDTIVEWNDINELEARLK